MAFLTTVHSLKANVTTLNPLRQHVPFKTYLHFQFKIGPQYSLSLSLTRSLSLSLTDTHLGHILLISLFFTFSFGVHFLLSSILFQAFSLSFSLTYSYCFLSLIFCFSLLDRTLQACVILALHVPLKTKTHLPSKTDNDLLLTVWLSDMQS